MATEGASCYCVICSDVVANGLCPRQESIKSLNRFFLTAENNETIPNFGKSEYQLVCSICFNKVELIHALFTRLDTIRKELIDCRQNFKEMLLKNPNSLTSTGIDPLRLEVPDGFPTAIIPGDTDIKVEADQNEYMDEIMTGTVQRAKVKSHDNGQENIEFENQFLLPPLEDSQNDNEESEESSEGSWNMELIQNPSTSRDITFPDAETTKQKKSKPKLTILQLICQAILSRPNQRATIQEIYAFMTANYSYYRNQALEKHTKWQNSVRHTLSINNRMFVKVNAMGEEGGRGWWKIKNCFKDSLNSFAFIGKEFRPSQFHTCLENEKDAIGKACNRVHKNP